MQMNFAACDMRQIATSVERLLRPEAVRQQITLRLHMPARLPRVSADAERIQQVLINLVGNALKFTPAGGDVTIELRQRGERQAVEVAVSDSGPGIRLQDQERIFDEFAQIHRASQNQADRGSGLGLAIARRIVEAHDGQLHVESLPGQGSSFVFSLPCNTIDDRCMFHR